MGYFYDGGIPPKDEKSTPTEGIEVDGVEQPTNSEFEKTMDNDTKEMLWRVMDENSQLKQENMMLKSKLNEIKRLF